MQNSSIDLQNFFPNKQLKVNGIFEDKTMIKIKLKSQTTSCTCLNVILFLLGIKEHM